jgi:hypothetical protein
MRGWRHAVRRGVTTNTKNQEHRPFLQAVRRHAMRVEIPTTKPKTLLAKIYQAIENGSIRTWTADSERDLTHVAPRWKGRAWLRPKVTDEGLTFEVIVNKDSATTLEEKAYYVGHFTETMVTHFSADFAYIYSVV